MKKEYMKPEINEIEVAANQAVAGCDYKYGDFKLTYRGETCLWDGGSESYNYYNTPEEQKAHGVAEHNNPNAEFAPVYDVTYDGNFIFHLEDKNKNGAWDGQGTDNWQHVTSWNMVQSVFNS